MPEVITDTSPLQYLYQLAQLDLLPALYRTHLRSQEGAASRFSMSLTKQRLSLVVV